MNWKALSSALEKTNINAACCISSGWLSLLPWSGPCICNFTQQGDCVGVRLKPFQSDHFQMHKKLSFCQEPPLFKQGGCSVLQGCVCVDFSVDKLLLLCLSTGMNIEI